MSDGGYFTDAELLRMADAEIAALRTQVERYKADFTAVDEALEITVNLLADTEAKLATATAALEKAETFMAHKGTCEVWAFYCGDLACKEHCDCGYLEALASIKSEAVSTADADAQASR